MAVATDVTYTGDHPGIEKKKSSIEMGKGPSITVSDAEGRGIIVPETVLKLHTPVSMLSMGDLENCALFVARAVEIVDRFF